MSYTCIAKGTVVLAEFASKEEPGIEEVASRCIENTPPHHSIFSHTVRKKTYTFAIDDDSSSSFVYFAITDETMEKPESFRVLNRLRSAVESLRSDSALIDPSPRCLQAKMDPVFAEIVGGGGDVDLELDMDMVAARESRNLSIDSTKGRRAALIPLLGKPLKALKKKNKKRTTEEDSGDDVGMVVDEENKKKVDLCGNNRNGGVLRKELRNGLLTDHHKAKQMWKKHVWVVLMFDFCVCAVLFGIWLWVCQGFQCVSG